MCKYCNFKMNTRWGESINCNDYENPDEEVGLYLHYSDVDKAYFLMGEYCATEVCGLGFSPEIKYCPFCGRKL